METQPLVLKWRRLTTFLIVLCIALLLVDAWLTGDSLREYFHWIRNWLLVNSGLSESMIFAAAVTGALLITWAISHVVTALLFSKKWLQLAIVAAIALFGGGYFYDKMNERICFNRAGEPLCDLVLTADLEYRQWRRSGPLLPVGWKAMGPLTRADETLIGPAPHELGLARCSEIEFFRGGVPSIYYSTRGNEFHLWNRDGYDHFTRARLKPVDEAELPKVCKQLDARVARAQATARARAEENRRRAEADAAVRVAAEQAENERQKRAAIDQANAQDFAAARVAGGSRNILVARRHVDAILARDPSNAEATQLSREWRLASACADCGSVMAIGESTVKQAQSAYPALFAGAAGAAAGHNSSSNDAKRDERAAKGALIGVALGTLLSAANASKKVFVVSVQMDDGRVEHVPLFKKPAFGIGARVVRTALGEQIQLSVQGDASPL